MNTGGGEPFRHCTPLATELHAPQGLHPARPRLVRWGGTSNTVPRLPWLLTGLVRRPARVHARCPLVGYLRCHYNTNGGKSN